MCSLPRATLSAATGVCSHLHQSGFVIVRLPPRVVSLVRRAETAFRAFFGSPDDFKDSFRTSGVDSRPGYLTPFPGAAELFEVRARALILLAARATTSWPSQNSHLSVPWRAQVRRSQIGDSYRMPPNCAQAAHDLFDALRILAMSFLSELSFRIAGSAEVLAGLVRYDSGPSALRAMHYDRIGELPAQLSKLPPSEAEEALRGTFPPHTDGSLLTLAPRAACAGLRVRHYGTGAWVDVEEAMAPDEAIVFAGDALSFVSRHHLPALMHHADASRMLGRLPQTRLSLPFFLYPDAESVLDASATLPYLLRAIPLSGPTLLPARDLVDNTHNCRDGWPWKRLAYYQGLVMTPD